jgi:hypothetical protein
MEYQVSFETVVEQLIVAARQRTAFRSIAREIGELLGRSWAFLKERSELRLDGHNAAIYWDERGASRERGTLDRIANSVPRTKR